MSTKQNEYCRRYYAKTHPKQIKTIDTDSIEKELLKYYNNNEAVPDALRYMIDVWKIKHKIPSNTKEDFDFSQLMGDSPAKTQS
jgi:hypothetical protein